MVRPRGSGACDVRQLTHHPKGKRMKTVTNINSRPEGGAFWNIVSSPAKVTHPCFSVVLPVDPAIGGCGATVVAQWLAQPQPTEAA